MKMQTRLTMDEVLWTLEQTAAFLQMSRSWVYHEAQKGLLPCIRFSRNLRFSPSAIRAYAAGLWRPETA